MCNNLVPNSEISKGLKKPSTKQTHIISHMHQRGLQGRPRGNHQLILCSGNPDACWVDKMLPLQGKVTSNEPLQPNTKIGLSPLLKHSYSTSGLCLWQMVCFNHATTITGSPDRIILFMPHNKPNTFMFYLKHDISSITLRPLKKVWFLHYDCMWMYQGSLANCFLGLLSSPFNWIGTGRYGNLIFTQYVQQGTQHAGKETNMALQTISHITFKDRRRRNWLPQIKK